MDEMKKGQAHYADRSGRRPRRIPRCTDPINNNRGTGPARTTRDFRARNWRERRRPGPSTPPELVQMISRKKLASPPRDGGPPAAGGRRALVCTTARVHQIRWAEICFEQINLSGRQIDVHFAFIAV
ncbi:hypothetical protein EVAR_82841_1 [Eumeta japonica]|uniref:Uncharacterized protein n=1 Tax=Eumeta variegata TaxID=151549 RepID=A0A4C1V2G6_EUMVA|nr:hypothetical protein EVAR_82841_1 [Eumeta japonica]